MSPFGPFDYFPTINDNAAIALDKNLEPFWRPESLSSQKTRDKLPLLMNNAMQATFFHETGPWWAADGWERVRIAYRERAHRFEQAVRNGRRLYVFCLVGAGDPELLIESYVRNLDDESSRLLVVNVRKEPLPTAAGYPRVEIVNSPYPEDYTWTEFGEYTSERGFNFELHVANAIREQIDLLPPLPNRKNILLRSLTSKWSNR